MTEDEIVALRDGSRVRVRPISPGDQAALQRGYRRLSPESQYRRFQRSERAGGTPICSAD